MSSGVKIMFTDSNSHASERPTTRADKARHLPPARLPSTGNGVRRGSSSDRHPRGEPALPTPMSPHLRLTRKRSASQMSANGADETDQHSGATGILSPGTGDSTSQVCLCPPDPKIPRPRNAFMLYRQHLQSAVVTHNPGLANPEISKIIGKQWREERQEIKDYWDALAEVTPHTNAAFVPCKYANTEPVKEEKSRHHQQYPNYKYQPRRKGKKPTDLPRRASSSASEENCGKCGRRSINTPSTPGTPFTPNHTTPNLPPPTPSTTSTASRRLSMEIPRYLPPVSTPATGGQMPRRGFPGPLNMHSGLPIGHMRESAAEEEAMSPLTPGVKRQRLSNYPSPPPTMRGPSLRRGSLPYPSPQPGRMGPPPRPLNAHKSPHDMSLTLPPLQTTQSRSVEAMVMTIPYFNKIKVLSKISPPLPPPGPMSPVHKVRGAVVAIDGVDLGSVMQVVRWLEDELSRSDEGNVVTTFKGVGEEDDPDGGLQSHHHHRHNQEQQHRLQTQQGADITTNNSPTITNPTADTTENNKHSSHVHEVTQPSFEEYLRSVSSWHQKSEELIKYITTPPSPLSPALPDTSHQTSAAATGVSAATTSNSPHSTASSSPSPPSAVQTPIALIPMYMLTGSNRAASRIPINDAYAPLDHWQWAATLWRGIVGPDLTVWVQECAKEEIARFGGVEVKEDARALVVRRESGHEIESKWLRRVGFEVAEWVRGVKDRAKTGEGGQNGTQH
ncbi:MAG: hypothetical protein M1837_005893 [Sclerophora amabilis]|nr:MAG: hypothetical protein M1837_005893 [Sclerophora amabilis]